MIKITFKILIVFILSCCTNVKMNDVKKVNDLIKIDDNSFWYLNENDKNLSNFIEYKDSLVECLVGETWDVIKSDKYLLYASIDTTDENVFFVVVRHEKSKIGLISQIDYMNEVVKILDSDTLEKVKNKRFYFAKQGYRSVTIGQATLENSKDTYCALMLYSEDNKYIYDFTMKSKKELDYRSHFIKAVNSFKLNGSFLIDNKDINNIYRVNL